MARQDDTLRIQMRSLAQAQNQLQGKVNAVFVSSKGPKKDKSQNPHSKPEKKDSKPPEKEKPKGGDSTKWCPCHRCGRRHNVKTCPAANRTCHTCNKVGHISRRCPERNENAEVHTVHSNNPSGILEDDSFLGQLLD